MKLNDKLITELKEFLVLAKISTYAAGDSADKIINGDKSTTLVFSKDNWSYHDNYFGGEPYGGREVVFYKNKPVWMMVYYGAVTKNTVPVKKIYDFLAESLKKIPKNNPYRGPKNFEISVYNYKNNYSGDLANFYGEEEIFFENEKIFFTKYSGGYIDI